MLNTRLRWYLNQLQALCLFLTGTMPYSYRHYALFSQALCLILTGNMPSLCFEVKGYSPSDSAHYDGILLAVRQWFEFCVTTDPEKVVTFIIHS